MDDIGLRVSDLFSEISDNELDVVMSGIIQQFPNCGYRLMAGFKKSEYTHPATKNKRWFSSHSSCSNCCSLE